MFWNIGTLPQHKNAKRPHLELPNSSECRSTACAHTYPDGESSYLNSAMAMSHQLLHNSSVGPVGNPAFSMTSLQPRNQSMDATENPRGMGLSQYMLRSPGPFWQILAPQERLQQRTNRTVRRGFLRNQSDPENPTGALEKIKNPPSRKQLAQVRAIGCLCLFFLPQRSLT